jgi:Ca-activated chloride channel family protein
VTDKGDPLLAHWQFGLGRAVAFTSDAKAKWSKNWLGWGKYQQFWSQIAQWSLRRLENSDFTTDVSVDGGGGQIGVEALDDKGNYVNFLDLEARVVSPKGEETTVHVEQTGPGHYEAKFPTKQVGTYMVNLLNMKDGKAVSSQRLGASINYSPEFAATEPNYNLLQRLAESGGGRVLDPENPADNTFQNNRQETYQPRDLWEWLLKMCVLLFPIDVGVRRIQLDRDEMRRAWRRLLGWILFWRGVAREPEAEESLAALLARREQVRSTQTAPAQPSAELFKPQKQAPLSLGGEPDQPPGQTGTASTPEPEPKDEAKSPPASTTSRLLDAKRRAQRRKE